MTNNLSSATMPNPVITPMNWQSHPQKLILNINYQQIAKEFFEKYAHNSSINLFFNQIYYNNESVITLNIHQNGMNSFEFRGYDSFRAKMFELSILIIKYNNITMISQPLGKNSVLINLYGSAEINNKIYPILIVFTIKLINGSLIILNHIFNIFYNNV